MEAIMRAVVLSAALFFALGSLCYGQNLGPGQNQGLGQRQGAGPGQPQTLKGVYAPPSLSALGHSGKSSTLSGSDLGAVGSGPRVILPGGPIQGEELPGDVTPRPIPDRPGYGAVTVNGRRVVVDLNTNRIYQILDRGPSTSTSSQ
jgi:Protein of unknown function (DUF1236)